MDENHQLTAVELIDAEYEVIENVNLLIGQVKSSIELPELEYPIDGLFPGVTYTSAVYPHLDGSKTLRLNVAPLQYDKENGNAYFYKRMKFRLTAEPSLISVMPSHWADSVALGGTLEKEFEIRNTRQSNLDVSIEKKGDIGNFVDFDTSTFSLLPGESIKIKATLASTEEAGVGTLSGEFVVKSTGGEQSVPVIISVFAPAPKISVWKEFKPTSIHEKRSGAVMPKITVANSGPVEVAKLEINDEILDNWTIKNINSVSVSYFDNENVEFEVSKKVLEISVENRKLKIKIDFSGGIEVNNGGIINVINSLEENEIIEIKYPTHPSEKLQSGLYESQVAVKATTPDSSNSITKATSFLEIYQKHDQHRGVRSDE